MFTKPFRIYQVDLLNAVICFGLFPKEAKYRYFVVSTGNCLASNLDSRYYHANDKNNPGQLYHRSYKYREMASMTNFKRKKIYFERKHPEYFPNY